MQSRIHPSHLSIHKYFAAPSLSSSSRPWPFDNLAFVYQLHPDISVSLLHHQDRTLKSNQSIPQSHIINIEPYSCIVVGGVIWWWWILYVNCCCSDKQHDSVLLSSLSLPFSWYPSNLPSSCMNIALIIITSRIIIGVEICQHLVFNETRIV